MSSRSLLLSYLLGTHPPDVPAARLVAFGELFGLQAGTVRTALSRMAANGDLVAQHGRYQLVGRLLNLQRELDRGQRQTGGAWTGEWWTVLATADARTLAERRRFRAAMKGALLGEIRPGIWMRPANLATGNERTPINLESLGGSDVIVTCGPVTNGDDVALAARLWDLDTIESTSAEIVGVLEPAGTALEQANAIHDHKALAELLPLTFEVSAAAARHLRTEPQLPRDVFDSSASEALRTTYAEVTDVFRRVLDQYLRQWPTG